MVERFILPEVFSGTAEPGIGVPSGNTFDDTGDFGKREVRVQEDVDMVGHDHVSVQIVAAEIGAAPDGIFGVVCQLGIGQPKRAGLCGVQGSIELAKYFSCRFF